MQLKLLPITTYFSKHDTSLVLGYWEINSEMPILYSNKEVTFLLCYFQESAFFSIQMKLNFNYEWKKLISAQSKKRNR